MDSMRLNGSYTVENSFIMPIFVLVIVLLLNVTFYIHDAVILKNSALKLAVRAERMEEEKQISELRRQGIEYISNKTICTQNVKVTIENNKGEVKVTCMGEFSSAFKILNRTGVLNQSAEVEKNRPDDFIRVINAAKEAVE